MSGTELICRKVDVIDPENEQVPKMMGSEEPVNDDTMKVFIIIACIICLFVFLYMIKLKIYSKTFDIRIIAIFGILILLVSIISFVLVIS